MRGRVNGNEGRLDVVLRSLSELSGRNRVHHVQSSDSWEPKADQSNLLRARPNFYGHLHEAAFATTLPCFYSSGFIALPYYVTVNSGLLEWLSLLDHDSVWLVH